MCSCPHVTMPASTNALFTMILVPSLDTSHETLPSSLPGALYIVCPHQCVRLPAQEDGFAVSQRNMDFFCTKGEIYGFYSASLANRNAVRHHPSCARHFAPRAASSSPAERLSAVGVSADVGAFTWKPPAGFRRFAYSYDSPYMPSMP